jgi:hypothetical protein
VVKRWCFAKRGSARFERPAHGKKRKKRNLPKNFQWSGIVSHNKKLKKK